MANQLTIKGGGISQAAVLALIAANAAPLAHKTQHQNGGSDAITVQGLAGVLTAEQLSSWAGVSGKPTTFPSDPGEGYTFINFAFPSSTDQGTWAIVVNSLYYLSGYFNNSSAANGDNISYTIYLAAGTYSLDLLYGDASNRGIIQILIDNVQIASKDTYSAGGGNERKYTQTGIVVATSGVKTLKMNVNGKNAASSGYLVVPQTLSLHRTA